MRFASLTSQSHRQYSTLTVMASWMRRTTVWLFQTPARKTTIWMAWATPAIPTMTTTATLTMWMPSPLTIPSGPTTTLTASATMPTPTMTMTANSTLTRPPAAPIRWTRAACLQISMVTTFPIASTPMTITMASRMAAMLSPLTLERPRTMMVTESVTMPISTTTTMANLTWMRSPAIRIRSIPIGCHLTTTVTAAPTASISMTTTTVMPTMWMSSPSTIPNGSTTMLTV